MNRLLMFVGTTGGGYIGWWAGDSLGFGMMGAFVISSIGSLIGVVAAWKVIVNYLE
jgi:hypothetical protein